VNDHDRSVGLSREWQWILLVSFLIVNDCMMTALAFNAAYLARFEWSLPFFQLEILPDINFYFRFVLAALPIWLLIFATLGLYSKDTLLGGTQEYALVFRGTTIGLMLIIVAGFLEPDLIIARGWLLVAWLFSFLFIGSGRFLIRRAVHRARTMGYFLTPAIVVGMNQEAQILVEQLKGWETSGLLLIGVISEDKQPSQSQWEDIPVLGGIDQLEAIVNERSVREIVLATSALNREEMLKIFKQFGVSGAVNLRLSSGLFEIITTGLRVKELAYVPLVTVNRVRLRGFDRVLKTILDYGLVIPALIVLAPFLGVIAVAVKLDSPGPIIHRRRVMGLNRKVFDAFKFRTMYVDGDEILAQYPELQVELAENHKLRVDPRVTKVGRLLRSLSLDELPQLINVLRGEMSLVGPRMISPPEMRKYNRWGLNLLTVKPGITGLWQVSGRSDINYDERVRLDMYYIRNWTLWLDLFLILHTIPAVLRKRGAY
jgi:exopolysaccharide biosynthesis polyprenyl glycosylphosphotransferase